MVISLGFPGPAARSIVPALNGHRAHHSTQAVWVHVHVDAFVLPCPDLHTQERTSLFIPPVCVGRMNVPLSLSQ